MKFSRSWIFPAVIIAALIWLGAQTLTSTSPWWSILTSLLPFVLLFGFWVFLMRMVKQRTPTAQDPQETRPPY